MPTKNMFSQKHVINTAHKGTETISQKLKKFLKIYESHCRKSGSSVDALLKKTLLKFIEDSKLLVKFTLQESATQVNPSIRIDPLIKTFRESCYKPVTDLCFWNLNVISDDLFSLSTFMKQNCYCVEYLELVRCALDSYFLDRFSSFFEVNSILKVVVFDYTQLEDDGLLRLSVGLLKSTSVTKLSLCYCNLTYNSGVVLGNLIANTAISELYINGNNLQCFGVMQLMRKICEKANQEILNKKLESENTLTASDNENSERRAENATHLTEKDVAKKTNKSKKKRTQRKRLTKKTVLPVVGPWLTALHVCNNGIDSCDVDHPVDLVRLLRSWLIHSPNLTELDLGDNLIGNVAARELLEALIDREKAGLKPIFVRTTHRLDEGVFKSLIKVSASLTKRSKKKKKKRASAGKRRV